MRVKKAYFLIGLTGLSLIFLLGNDVQAESVRKVETDGTVQFYGKYDSELEPEPHPPGGSEPIPPTEGIQKPRKPGGLFPQTGHFLVQYWFWLGTSILLLAVIIWRKKKESDYFEISYDFN